MSTILREVCAVFLIFFCTVSFDLFMTFVCTAVAVRLYTTGRAVGTCSKLPASYCFLFSRQRFSLAVFVPFCLDVKYCASSCLLSLSKIVNGRLKLWVQFFVCL